MRYKYFILLAAASALLACSETNNGSQDSSAGREVPVPEQMVANQPEAPAPSTAVAVSLPVEFAKAEIKKGECMSPVDFVNGVPPASLAAQTAGAELTLLGWNLVSKDQGTVPPAIFAVLKSGDASAASAILSGKRTERPDVAKGNPEYLMTGFELKGAAPTAAGRYRVFIRTGTQAVLYDCDTQVDIEVR